jgi:manganese/zinc/iron transport system permease protein
MIHVEIAIIAILVAYAAVLPGIFLVLRGVSLMSDAISHSVLLGIAVMFLIVQSLSSPWLFIGASCAGIATVMLTEAVIATGRLKQDAAIGIVFPLFFSIGIILISLFARNVHLDIDMVILGELVFAPFNRFIVYGVDLGPYALWSIGSIAVINTVFVSLFYKELKVSVFDPDFSTVLGFSPTIIYYGLMMVTSITAVGAFEVVGSIVVVALMITIPATAYLLASRLYAMIQYSVGLSILIALTGYAVAYIFDVSIAGSIAMMSGIVFLIVLIFTPENGLLAYWTQSRRARVMLAKHVLKAYLQDRQGNADGVEEIVARLGWSRTFILHTAKQATDVFDVARDDTIVLL